MNAVAATHAAPLRVALVGVPMRRVLRLVQDQRDARYNLLRGYFHGADDDTVNERDQERLSTVTLPVGAKVIGQPLGGLALPAMGVRVVNLRRGDGHPSAAVAEALLAGPWPGRIGPGGASWKGAIYGPSGAGGVIYRPGKFGTKAAQFGGATANYVSNPSFETGTTGWSAWASATLDQTTADAYVGSYAMRITHVASSTSGALATYTTAVAGSYTASVYLRSYQSGDIGYNCSILMRFNYTDASTEDTSYNHTITGEWERISVTATTNGAKTLSSIYVYLRDLLSGGSHYTLIDAVQLENNSYASAYCDGSLGTGHSWSGTAHASTSTRTAAQLTYPTSGNIHDEVGTFMAWVYVYRSAGVQTIMRIQGSTAGNIYMLISSGNLAGYWGTAEVTDCLLYTSPSPRDRTGSRMPSSA